MTRDPGADDLHRAAVRIAASPATVWQFWTDADLVTEWWGVDAEVVAEPGGRYRVVMAGGRVIVGAFTDLDPPNPLAFSFGWDHTAPGEPLAPGSTSVEVTLVRTATAPFSLCGIRRCRQLTSPITTRAGRTCSVSGSSRWPRARHERQRVNGSTG